MPLKLKIKNLNHRCRSEQWGIRSVVKRKTSIDRTAYEQVSVPEKKLIFFPVRPFFAASTINKILYFSIGVIAIASESAVGGWGVGEGEGRGGGE